MVTVGQDVFALSDIIVGSKIWIRNKVKSYKIRGIDYNNRLIFVDGFDTPITARDIEYINCREEFD